MVEARIIDTFPAFLAYWQTARERSMAQQIEGWADRYMAPWPELLQKQVDDYAEESQGWRSIAGQHVFPDLERRLPNMAAARQQLLANCQPVYERTQQKLAHEIEVIFVIYVGIGCGAGWATTYDEKPAVLFGLENIAEEGWSQAPAIKGLIAHELGHLVHFRWREEGGLITESGPWWQLYTEGFAQWCEHLVAGQETWHMRQGAARGWLSWCQANQPWLAAEFLRQVDAGEDIRSFFGSWYDIKGHKQTGYFLGHELIRAMQVTISLKELALLDGVAARCRLYLEKMAGNLD